MSFHKELEGLKKEKSRADKKGNLREVAQLCNVIGELYSRNGHFDDAIEEHEMELALSESLEDSLGAAVAYRKIGECYCEKGDFHKALQHQKKHLKIAEQCDSNVECQRAYATIGRTYLFQAESLLLKDPSHSQNVLKKAENAFLRSLEVCQQLKENTSQKEYAEMRARLLLNLGLVYDYQGSMKKCAEYIKQAISIAEKHGLHEDLYRCQYSLATIYQRTGNLTQALRFLDVAIKSAQKRRDKTAQSEALTLKCLIFLHLGDRSAAKKCIRKAYKFGHPVSEEKLRIEKIFRAALKMERLHSVLAELDEMDYDAKLTTYEKLGDISAHIMNYKQAVGYYHQMLKSAEALNMAGSALIPIYVSLAQTYMDDKQYDKALEFFRKELDCRQGDHEQECRTWLNIAEVQEYNGDTYEHVKVSYQKALECARKAKHMKLQVRCLKSLSVSQKGYKENEDYEDTVSRLETLKDQHDIASDDELSDVEDSQEGPEEDEEEMNLEDYSDSDDSAEEEYDHSRDGGRSSRAGRARRFGQVKRNEKGETPLHRACIDGNLKKVKTLVEQGHPMNPRDFSGWLPLHEACNHGYQDIVGFLLEHGAWINDRGGEHCGGVTPLHDAANCGNVDIINLLVKRGANVHAKDEEGNTPRECLVAFRKRSQDQLEHEEIFEIREAEHLLKNTMTGNNPHLSQPSRAGLCALMEDDPLPTINRKPRRRPLSRTPDDSCENQPVLDSDIVSQHSDSESIGDIGEYITREYEHGSRRLDSTTGAKFTERHRIVTDDEEEDEEDSEDVYRTAAMDSVNILDSPSAARSAYCDAISSLGSVANRSGIGQSQPTPQPKSKTPALLDADECVGDDWLIEDVRPSNTSKRKRNAEHEFTAGGSRSTLLDDNGYSKKRRQSSGPRVAEITSHNSNEIPNFNDEVSINDNSDIDMVELSSSLPSLSFGASHMSRESRKQSSKLTLNKQKPKRQTKLTTFGSLNSTKTSQSLHDPDLEYALSASLKDSVRHQVGNNSSQPSQRGMLSVMRLRVKIKDKVLMVPVTGSSETQDIGWLAREASNRYYSLCGLRPVLSLATTDGAMLSPSDLVAVMLSNNEEIEGIVDSWDLPPLPERYRDACKTAGTVVYGNIKAALQTAASSNCLQLCDLALKPAQFLPICRALQCQTSLQELRIAGNRFGDEGIAALTKVLSTLSTLRVLGLRCNRLSDTALRHLVEALEAPVLPGSEKPLQHLETLDLSFNPLGDSCTQTLTSLLLHLPVLCRLKLEACDLTLKFFQQHRMQLGDALQKLPLEEFVISHNALGSTGVELLLRCLRASRVSRLDLAGVLHSYSINHLVKNLLQFVAQGSCSLQSLVLDKCNLSDEQAEDIAKMVCDCPSLTSLSCSANTKLGSYSLSHLLHTASQSDSSRLEQLVFNACGIATPLDTAFLDAIGDKLNHSHPLTHLEFTCTELNQVDTDSLADIWRSRWSDLACCNIKGGRVKLTVKQENC